MDNSLLLSFFGIFIGLFGALFGGGQFFAYPLFQLLFPGLNFGQIVGNTKMGGFTRGIATTFSTRKHLEIKECFFLAIPIVIGTSAGASFIASLNEKWMFPAILLAILLAELAPRFADKIKKKHIFFASIFLGIYAGFLGAGIGILILAILRAKYPHDHHIAHAKIQARFIEFFTVFIALGAHIYHGNIIWKIALLWGLGAFVGGIIGGEILKKMKKVSAKNQKIFLWISFAFAIFVSGWKFFVK